MTEPVLEVKHLSIDVLNATEPHRLMSDLSFSIPKAKTLAMVGSSGAGKSMTSLAIMGLLPEDIQQTTGEIILNGHQLNTSNTEEWRNIRNTKMSMIMQNPMSAFDPVFTIRSHFIDTLRAHQPRISKNEVEKRAYQALTEAGFAEPQTIYNIYPFQMSGGMLQRVMIALALINHPQILIADEATTDLDVVLQANIIELLKQRTQERGMSVLLITHDLSIAAHLADDVVIVDQGKVIEANTVQNIFFHPQAMFTKQLIKAHLDLYEGGFSDLWAKAPQ